MEYLHMLILITFARQLTISD